MTLSLIFLNVANVVYVICYLVKDVLLLRILAVAAMLTIIPYYFMHHSEPMYEPLAWNGLFMAINLFWIVMIFRERQKPRLSELENEIYEKTFQDICSERDMLRILESAEWKDFQAGDVIVTAKTNPEKLILIHTGVANVIFERKRVARLRPGDLVAEMSFLTGDQSVADVVASRTMRVVVWKTPDLRKMFESRPELKTSVYQLIGHDLIEKLGSTRGKIPEMSISMASDYQPPEDE